MTDDGFFQRPLLCSGAVPLISHKLVPQAMLCTTFRRTSWVDLLRTPDMHLRGLAVDADVIGRPVGVGGTQQGYCWGISGQGCCGISRLHRPICAQANVVVFSIRESILNILALSTSLRMRKADWRQL